MKRFPQIDRFLTAVCSYLILVIFILLTSCEKESLQDDFSRIKALKTETASLISKLNYDSSVDCSSVCIESGSGNYYVKSDSKSVTSGNSGNTKNVSYNAYNTETQFIVEVLYVMISGNSNAHSDITIEINGSSKTFLDKAKGTMVSYSIDLPLGWKACSSIINFKIHEEGMASDIDFNENYSLIGVCDSGCDESFSYEENENGSYTFTYISSEDLENAEVKITCPHIAGFETLDDKSYTVNPGNSHGSPTVLTWIGDIDACTEMTFTLSFEADCDQTNSGKANLFTDFKVNSVSKKGNNENIVFQCPE